MKSPRHEPIFMAPNDHPRVRLEVSGGPNDPPWTHLWPMKGHMTRILCIFWRSWARNGSLMESPLSCDTHNAVMTVSATAVFPWSIWRVSSADGRLWWRSPLRMKYTQIIPDPLFNSLTSAPIPTHWLCWGRIQMVRNGSSLYLFVAKDPDSRTLFS